MTDLPSHLIEVEGAPAFHFRQIPAGRFVMGSVDGLPFSPEGPEHLVEVPGFYMGEAPVTARQFEMVMKHNPSHFRGDPELPVESVTWLEAQEFCKSLSASCETPVRLPSEAEWEYACRAGSCTQFHFGDAAAELTQYAWFENNSGERTAPVRLKKPNAWGLFDMIGNVWEWCADLWHEDYTGAPCDGSAWITSVCSRHRRYCVRGGAWDMDAFRCRSSYRSYDWEDVGTSRTGFRVAASIEGRRLSQAVRPEVVTRSLK